MGDRHCSGFPGVLLSGTVCAKKFSYFVRYIDSLFLSTKGIGMDPVRLSKSFSYANTVAGKGAIFHGGIFADENGLYLIHNKHSWESAGTATAAFGLLGALIHHLVTRKKPVEYPFPTLPITELPSELQVSLNTGSFKETAEVTIIPKDQIQGYTKSMLKGSKFLVGAAEIVVLGAAGKAIKQLPEMGYEQV